MIKDIHSVHNVQLVFFWSFYFFILGGDIYHVGEKKEITILCTFRFSLLCGIFVGISEQNFSPRIDIE